MKHGAHPVETARLNGWGVGTRLVGDEGYGPTVIEITAMGERTLLARAVSRQGRPVDEVEGTWVLDAREWTEVEPGLGERRTTRDLRTIVNSTLLDAMYGGAIDLGQAYGRIAERLTEAVVDALERDAEVARG